MNIFESLRASHDTQRMLCDQLDNADNKDHRENAYGLLKLELEAHAAAEERAFYMPLMERDSGLDLSRHAIAEHHEMDEMIYRLDELDTGSQAWKEQANELTHKVRHHLEEEEQKFFQMAGKILTDDEKSSLATDYKTEEAEYKKAHG